MAFTSETILKFGSTTINFAVVTLLDYNLEAQKAGSFAYRRKENFSVQGHFSNRESAVPISEHFRQVKALLENSTDFVDLQLNEKSYGKVRFTGFSFPTSVSFDENAVRFSKFTISMEVYKDDSSGDYASSNLPTAIGPLTADWHKVKNFSESLNFALSENGNFEVSHSLSFGVDNIDKISDIQVCSLANSIANSFFAQGLDALSSIRYLYSSTSFQISNSDYGSSLTDQNIDLINYNFSYTKNYTIFSDNSSSTSETLLTEISINNDGLIEVYEKGRVKGKGSTLQIARQNAIAKLESNLTSAYSRCNSYFGSYFSTYYSKFAKLIPKVSSSETLKSNPLSISKDLSGVENEVGYDIRFSTSSGYTNSTRIHTYSISLTKNDFGIIESVIQGSVKYYTNKNSNFNNVVDFKTNIIDSPSPNDISSISPYYQKMTGSASNYSGKKTSTQINYTKFGAEIQYSKTYSDSPALSSSGLISECLISDNTNVPINKYSTVNVPNHKEIIYQTRQLSEGTKTISIAMKINRSSLYSEAASNLDKSIVFAKIKTLLTTNMLDKSSGYLFGSTPVGILAFSKIFNQGLSFKVGELTYFLESIKLSLDSSYNLKADLVYKFLALKEKLK